MTLLSEATKLTHAAVPEQPPDPRSSGSTAMPCSRVHRLCCDGRKVQRTPPRGHAEGVSLTVRSGGVSWESALTQGIEDSHWWKARAGAQ